MKGLTKKQTILSLLLANRDFAWVGVQAILLIIIDNPVIVGS